MEEAPNNSSPPLTPEETAAVQKEAKTQPLRVNVSTTTTNKQLSIRTAIDKTIIPMVDRFNALHRLLNTTVIIGRWLRKNRERRTEVISAAESRAALLIHIRQDQSLHFGKEIALLQNNRQTEIKNPLAQFAPFLDEEGNLRVGGRLRNSELPYAQKHPIILNKTSRLAEILIQDAHQATLHGGIQEMLHHLRQEFWIINGRAMTKTHLHNCVTCKKHQRTGHQQQMASLPRNRVLVAPAFTHASVDYAGPFHIRLGNARKTTTKSYVVVFVCQSVKAIHLELAEDLSALSFLEVFDRFISRRGKPCTILSDNGTQFVGASRIMNKDLEQWRSKEVQQHVASHGVDWKFIVPGAPHHGGLWEAAVKSVKKHLLRVVGRQSLRYGSFATLLTRIEACLNSRPIISIFDDPETGTALSPGHFLIGRPLTARLQSPIAADIPENRLKYHQRFQRMLEHFWSRWSLEYLAQLQARNKWIHPHGNLKTDDVVAIMDDNLPPCEWRIGRITQTHPGPDDLVRSVSMDVMMPGGGRHTMQRPIQKLCRLVENNDS